MSFRSTWIQSYNKVKVVSRPIHTSPGVLSIGHLLLEMREGRKRWVYIAYRYEVPGVTRETSCGHIVTQSQLHPQTKLTTKPKQPHKAFTFSDNTSRLSLCPVCCIVITHVLCPLREASLHGGKCSTWTSNRTSLGSFGN